MKKFAKLLLLVVLALVMSMSVACRGGVTNDPNNPNSPGGGDTGITEEVDYSRTQLYVSNFNGGYGDEWLYKLKARFEEFYKETTFEEGKKGVQVLIDNAKSNGAAIATQIAGSRNEVFFSESVYYYDMVNPGLVADITDIVTSSLEDYGEEGTIEAKLNDQQKDYYGVKRDGDTKPKYYGLPHYSAFNGIMYDVDFFDEKGFYFVADPNLDANENKYNTWLENGNNGIMVGKNDPTPKSNGPDGKPDTDDDGLPATYDEFFVLCQYMADGGVTPVVWTGQHQKTYNDKTLQALAVDYEGPEQMMLNFNFNDTAKNLVQSINSDGTVVKKAPTPITAATGYELYSSAGRYYALSFFERLVSNREFYHSDCYNTTASHLQAQKDFLWSRPMAAVNQQEPVAMLMEGIWWENEAKDAFATAETYGEQYGRYKRRIGFMPLPKATKGEVGDGFTVMDTHYSLGFINANCEPVKLDIAKKFLKFAYTDQSLVEFTVTTNTPKALNYEVPDLEKAKMSYFGRSVLDIKEKANIVYPYSNNPTYLNHQSELNYSENFIAKVGTEEYNNAGSILRSTVSNHLTAEQFFNGIINRMTQSKWVNDFGPF